MYDIMCFLHARTIKLSNEIYQDHCFNYDTYISYLHEKDKNYVQWSIIYIGKVHPIT